MAVVYVREHGATVGVVNERVQIKRKRRVVKEIPAVHVDRLVLMVPAYITQPAVRYFMDKGIHIVYVSQNGRFYGQFTRGDGTHVQLRLAQYRKFSDNAFRLKIATGFIDGKISGIQSVWSRQRRLGDLGPKLTQVARIHEKLKSVKSLESLRGLEGSATAINYAILRKALLGEWHFKRREYHPPRDPVNAMLSLGYTLLYSHMSSLIQMHGLDPYLGFFHEPKRGHAALASDMIEEWRCPVVDALVLRLVNTKQITPGNFTTVRGRCTMAKDSLGLFTTQFEKRLQNFQGATANNGTDPVGGMAGQVRQLARVLMETQADYAAVDL